MNSGLSGQPGSRHPFQWLSWKTLLPVWSHLPTLVWVAGPLGTSPLGLSCSQGVRVEGMPCEHCLRARECFCLFNERLFFFSLSSLFCLSPLLCSGICSQMLWPSYCNTASLWAALPQLGLSTGGCELARGPSGALTAGEALLICHPQ